MAQFWSNSNGWAPKEAAVLLSKSRLDYFASLASNLNLTVLTPLGPKRHHSGRLILAWGHLGSLLECTLQLFLVIYIKNYLKDKNSVFRGRKKPKLLLPQDLRLENLRVFYDKSIWDTKEKKLWTPWILKVQQRRNAIHPLKPRSIGTLAEFQNALREYLVLLKKLDDRMPYPDPDYMHEDF